MNDCWSCAQGSRVGFIKKYQELLNPCDIVELRSAVLTLIEHAVNYDAAKAGQSLAAHLEGYNVPKPIVDALEAALPQKPQLVEHYRKAIVVRCTRSLVDFNYSVKVILCSDTTSLVKVPIVQLELFIKDAGNSVERVVLELNKEELATFIEQLTHIAKVAFDWIIA